jgi:hypothetical protein
MRVATAGALLRLDGTREAVEVIRDGLASPDFMVAGEALDASLALGVDGIDLLVTAAARNPDDQIRVGAAMRALYLAGVTDSPMSWSHRELVLGLADRERSVRQRAFDEVCRLIGTPSRTEVD